MTQAVRGVVELADEFLQASSAPDGAFGRERRDRLRRPCRRPRRECPCFISRRTMLPPIRPRPIMPSCMFEIP